MLTRRLRFILFLLLLAQISAPALLHAIQKHLFWPARLDVSIGGGLQPMAVGDFDEDGHQDLAVTLYVDNRTAVFLGSGTGHFHHRFSSQPETGPKPFLPEISTKTDLWTW